MKRKKIKLSISCLPHTWFIDLDGTVFLHNEYRTNNKDTLCNSYVTKFFQDVHINDFIVFTTSRSKKYSTLCENSIKKVLSIKQKYIVIYDLPHGERILINDKKPSGLETSISISIDRNEFPSLDINYDKNL